MLTNVAVYVFMLHMFTHAHIYTHRCAYHIQIGGKERQSEKEEACIKKFYL